MQRALALAPQQDMASAGRTANINEIRGVLDAARLLTATIGSLADGMTGENKRGDQYGWHNACPN